MFEHRCIADQRTNRHHAELDEVFAERWGRLEPEEQTLVAMALVEIHAGTFSSRAAWERFVDAALELLPAMTNGTISPTELHEISLRHAFGDHE